MGMLEDIQKDLAERMSTHIDSRCATDDEVRIAWLVTEVERLMPKTKCVVCKNGITDDDWKEIKSNFDYLFAQVDALGMESLTENEQLLINREVHDVCSIFLD